MNHFVTFENKQTNKNVRYFLPFPHFVFRILNILNRYSSNKVPNM